MTRRRQRAIALPEAREQQCQIRRTKLEDLIRKAPGTRIGAPDPERPCPRHSSNWPRLPGAPDVHAVTVPMPSDGGSRVGESLHGINEFVAVLRIGCVEVQRGWMAEIAFGDEVCEYDQL